MALLPEYQPVLAYIEKLSDEDVMPSVRGCTDIISFSLLFKQKASITHDVDKLVVIVEISTATLCFTPVSMPYLILFAKLVLSEQKGKYEIHNNSNTHRNNKLYIASEIDARKKVRKRNVSINTQ